MLLLVCPIHLMDDSHDLHLTLEAGVEGCGEDNKNFSFCAETQLSAAAACIKHSLCE